MKIKDLVNRDLVNLTNCDQEPIHIPGSVQPHGLLIGVSASGMIDYCSSNVSAITGIGYQQLLGKDISVLLEGNNAFDILSTAADHPQSPISIKIKEHSYSCFAHWGGDTIIAEFEPLQDQPLALSDLYNLNLESINSLKEAHTLRELAKRISGQIKKITGYDRVMIYRFDEHYNGEVFAESKEAYLEPFLGLHYPHTDIPAQARQLYIKNLLRVIVDVNYTPSPLFTIDDTPGKNLDLSMAALRSVSPIHIEYLHNIGVRATLTISLIHEDRLWGLVACHHYASEKYLSAYTRVSAQLIANLLTSQIQVREVAEEYEMAKLINSSLQKLLIEPNDLNNDSFQKIIDRPALLAICNATGVALIINQQVYKAGRTPDHKHLLTIALALEGKSSTEIFSTTFLKEYLPDEVTVCDTAAGILYQQLDGHSMDCIVWFRPETNEEVHWAGDPDKAIIKNEKGLSPRNSFELWKQIIKCKSSSWAKPETTAANTFVQALQKHIHMFALSEEEFKYRKLSIELKEANAELENINWISTHDLKEPLRKIQVQSSRILSKDQEALSAQVIDSLKKMNASADRMQQLISDITSYSRLRHTEDPQLVIDLSLLVQSAWNELKEESPDSDLVMINQLPHIKGIPLLLTQLFLNIFRNAVKFRKKEIAAVITLSYAAEQTCDLDIEPGKIFHKISINDNGIGLAGNHLEAIFKVFTRLHNQRDYAGSGIGLAVCRQIMHIHKGYITATGETGHGAGFHLFFPQEK